MANRLQESASLLRQKLATRRLTSVIARSCPGENASQNQSLGDSCTSPSIIRANQLRERWYLIFVVNWFSGVCQDFLFVFAAPHFFADALVAALDCVSEVKGTSILFW